MLYSHCLAALCSRPFAEWREGIEQMETTLKEINAVVGVVGSFVCLPDGSIAARATPENLEAAQLTLAARVASQTFAALEASGQRVSELDLTYDQGRLLLKSLRGGILGILCARNLNLPLLNLTANAAVKKLAAELKPPKPVTPEAVPAPAAARAPVSAKPAAQTAAAKIPLPPLVAELEQEVQRLAEEGKRHQLRLPALNDVALWLACPHYRSLLPPLETRQIELGGLAAQAERIQNLFEQVGYNSDRRFNAFHGNRRLHFASAQNDTNVDVYLNQYEMYHRLDLTPFLSQSEAVLPVTALLLALLQVVEMNDARLRQLCALTLEHDLSVGTETGKIDASYITSLCAEDWGWFKTVSMNLDRLTSFATASLSPWDGAEIVERAHRLKQSMDGAPKSLRWQTRSRLGESVRWYDTPQVYRPASARPDMAMG